MPDRVKFGEMVEKRMAQFDDCLRKIEPLSRNYQHDPQDITEMIAYMRQGIDKLESLFTSKGKIGGFRFKNQETAPVLTDDTSNSPVKLQTRKAQS